MPTPNRSVFGAFPVWTPSAPPAKAIPTHSERDVERMRSTLYPSEEQLLEQSRQSNWRETERLARVSRDAPRIPWDVFMATELDWRAGEHFSLIGPTGQGKTTMMLHLLPLHPYVAAMATKPRDKTMDALIASGYIKLERWHKLDPDIFPRRVIWPDATRIDSEVLQRSVFQDAMAKIYREGGWTVAIDETWWFSNILKMDREIKTYLLQARSLGISLLAATQRPSSVPLELYDQASHLMFWRDNDENNLRRLGGISYRSAEMIRGIVSNLEQFQVLYINTRTGRMLRTRCPAVYMPSGGEQK